MCPSCSFVFLRVHTSRRLSSSVSESTLTDLVTRLERERLGSHRRYNEALTALDAAMPGPLSLPETPALPGDVTLLDLRRLSENPPAVQATGDGLLTRGLDNAVRRLMGPALAHQQRFNVAVVAHVTRNLAAERDARAAAGALIDATRRHLDALTTFHSRLIHIQQITPFVETKDREWAAPNCVTRSAWSTSERFP